jgi:tetratricopeptide (TPR) repeat protein
MSEYATRDVQRLLGMSRGAIFSLVRAGFVRPARGPRRAYLFSFQDLIALRTARGLAEANLSPRRISRSLRRLREQLPASVPLSGLRICAIGDQVVVKTPRQAWRADSGQYLLDFQVSYAAGELALLQRDAATRAAAPASAEHWFEQACRLEEKEPQAAREAYERALMLDPLHAAAYANLGRHLHSAGKLRDAERVYRKGIERCASDALLRFNFGVLLEDSGRQQEAVAAYQAALEIDRSFGDCHYNLALLYEAAGKRQEALRHLSEYRRLLS